MQYSVRKAEEKDLQRVLSLYESARSFMASHGNPDQWGKTNPPREQIEKDIREGFLYVLEQGNCIHGVFMFRIFEDPTYGYMEEGGWHSEKPYGVLHRVAGDGSGGILKAAVAFGEQQIDYLRIDTHEQNLPMQKAIFSQGFSYCGKIFLANGARRLAYDRVKMV